MFSDLISKLVVLILKGWMDKIAARQTDKQADKSF